MDGASLAVFRVLFGTIIACDTLVYMGRGRVAEDLLTPAYHFSYPHLGWVRTAPAPLLYLVFALIALAGLCVAAGALYRLSALILAVGLAYVFLLDEALYSDHAYQALLLAGLLNFVPANAVWTVNGNRERLGTPANTVPRWSLWLLRAQVAIVYAFGGIAKINRDWLGGEPLHSWMRGRTDLPWLSWLIDRRLDVPLFSYGGLLFDTLIVPALLWHRTRPIAFGAAIAFHIITSGLFDNLGLFPWIMLAGLTLFFDADWPRRLWAFVTGEGRALPKPGAFEQPMSGLKVVALSAYLAVQTIVPLRHHLYIGDVAWTEEGHRFAWRMFVHHKATRARFYVVNSSGIAEIDPAEYLRPQQLNSMSGVPEMILNFGHFIATRKQIGSEDVHVYADVISSVNWGPPGHLVSQDVDLAMDLRALRKAKWLTARPTSAEALPPEDFADRLGRLYSPAARAGDSLGP